VNSPKLPMVSFGLSFDTQKHYGMNLTEFDSHLKGSKNYNIYKNKGIDSSSM
jgi:hypothetical protein